jgi:hypothetical protein
MQPTPSAVVCSVDRYIALNLLGQWFWYPKDFDTYCDTFFWPLPTYFLLLRQNSNMLWSSFGIIIYQKQWAVVRWLYIHMIPPQVKDRQTLTTCSRLFLHWYHRYTKYKKYSKLIEWTNEIANGNINVKNMCCTFSRKVHMDLYGRLNKHREAGNWDWRRVKCHTGQPRIQSLSSALRWQMGVSVIWHAFIRAIWEMDLLSILIMT